MDKRKVSNSTKFKLFLEGRPFSIIGLVFTFISLIVFPVVITVISLSRESYEKYDHDAINNNGTEATAQITRIEPITNVSINGQNPVLLYYKYSNGSATVNDKFRTMDLDKAARFNPGDTITVKSLNNQSVITGMEPFSFPYFVFLLMPLPFLIAGIVFLIKGGLPALRKWKLYENGVVKDATITSLSMHSQPRLMNREYLLVTYYHLDRNGTKMYGEARTNDFTILGEKKAGDTIKIFVMEHDGSKSCLVPVQEARRNNWNIST